MSLLKTVSFIANHPLNRDNKTQALLNYFRWQIGSRILRSQTISTWIEGTRLIAYPGETGATGNIYCGLHEFADMAYVLHTVAQDDLFVDVGANIGAYTLLACGARNAQGVCFEPVPTTYRRLCDNLRLNNLTERVVAMNIGVGDTEAELAFSTDANCMNHVIAQSEDATNAAKVPVRTLDSVLSGQAPSLLKIDVEGYEAPVIAGAHSILAAPSLHSVIMELNGSGARYGYDEASILSSMQQHGFTPHVYEPFSRQLKRLERRNDASGNLIFVRNLDRVKERIAAARHARVGTMTF